MALAAAILLATAWPSPSPAAPGVIVAEATRISFPLTVEALGTTLANESVEIRPQVSEALTKIHFTEGQFVARGAILASLDDSESRAAVAAAKAALIESEGQYRRAEELRASDLVPETEFERLRARRDADRAALDAAESRLAYRTVRAPFAGRVGLRRVSVGSIVTPSTVITTLDATDPMKLDFDVPETAIGRIEKGLTIVARSAAWPDSTFRGRVDAVDTRVDPVSRTVTVRAVLPNRRGMLRPGMFLTVTLLRRDVMALVIPEQAIVPEQSRQFVLVVGTNGVVERREVRPGRRRPGQVEILSGLKAGETVVAEGTQKARAGESVEIVGRIPVKP
ncbi:MAG TPA: efflux RND transporter periplasmic adaptor subunit [Candidatus Eisenbacteria bacterium]|nr:efflux RND transporter periplasmic adaptor subunit [Candidatus Eisenbacteria bacterium]